jgi:hypothetical protein
MTSSHAQRRDVSETLARTDTRYRAWLSAQGAMALVRSIDF